MARKQRVRKPAAPKARIDATSQPGTDTGALEEQELNKVTGGGGDNPTESVSFNFGTYKPS